MSALRERQLATLARERPALVVVDVQRSFGDPEMLGGHGLDAAAQASVAAAVERCAVLVADARALGVPVYWVELGTVTPWRASQWLRDGDLDAPLGDDEPCVVGTPGAEWYGVQPLAGEARVRKTGYSGFLHTDLAARLRVDGIGWVAVVGLTTECCIQATATDAIQLGWPVYIPDDATAAYDVPLHAAALEQLALNVAVIGSSSELSGLWAGSALAADLVPAGAGAGA
ncbi:isochorismatase family cysteine hydrolase [Microbacterium paludicola]|uniref:cysteine hydrolase family protein n=1 Tax=Microbacterium paludicola TaxID=300019 RepID=UPI0031CFD7BB